MRSVVSQQVFKTEIIMLDFHFLTKDVILIDEYDENPDSNKKTQHYLVIITETGTMIFKAERI